MELSTDVGIKAVFPKILGEKVYKALHWNKIMELQPARLRKLPLRKSGTMAPKSNGNGHKVGRQHAVEYTYTLPTRRIKVKRYLADIKDLKYDLHNNRLETKLQKSGKTRNQNTVHELLQAEVKADNLAESLKVTNGFNEPLLITHDWNIKEGNRRRCACMLLVAEGLEQFQYVPVEELPDDITSKELDLLIFLRHVRRPLSWKSLDRWRQVQKLLHEGYTEENVATLTDFVAFRR